MSVENYTPKNAIAGDTQIVSDSVTVLSGQVIPSGSILGVVTADEKVKICKKDASDGSETPYCISVEDVDSSEGEITGVPVYLKCEYNENEVIVDPTWTLVELKTELRPLGIYLKSAVKR